MLKKKKSENVLIINFKTYAESSGKKADKLALAANSIAKKTGKKIILVVQETDIYRLSKLVDIPIYSEHLDPIEYGAHTGKVLAKTLKFNGAEGVLLNHSEDRFDINEIDESTELAKKFKLKVIICATDSEQAAAVSLFKPDFVAVEPSELIGTGISVSKSKPEIVSDSVLRVSQVSKVPLLCGAGISSGKDVRSAIDLGAKGVLVASRIVKSKKPEKIILEMAKEL